MIRITKRDGSLQELELSKIQRALLMAFNAIGPVPNVSPLVQRVAEKLSRLAGEGIQVNQVAIACETVLLESGYHNVAAAFMRYRVSRDEARARRLVPDNNALSDYLHVAKYAKFDSELERREIYPETATRCFEMHERRLEQWYESGRISAQECESLVRDLRAAFDLVELKIILASMRSMQFGGLAIEANNARLYNCSYTHVDRWEVFSQIFFLLLSGCGVGYSVQWQHVEKLSAVGRIDPRDVVHHTIGDSIEGWADAIEALIRSYESGFYVEFSYSAIRPEGSLLKTSGGLAPGHLPLKRCLERVRGILEASQGRRLRPLEAHDIVCHIAEAVLAGGIRRSSLISLFSPADTEMLYCKASGNFEPGGLNSHRQMANNSAALLRGSTDRALFDRIIRVSTENYGDPGFYWTDNLDYGSNPCGEIGLWPKISWCSQCRDYRSAEYDQCEKCTTDLVMKSGFQFCNLCEVNVAACATREDFLVACRAAAFIGTIQASYTYFPYLGPVTEAITKREALIGVGIMGMMDNVSLAFDPALLRCGAEAVVEENKRVAVIIGINQAARATTIKPGGTGPAVAGVSSGIGPRWARRYLNRVLANVGEPQFQYLKSINPHMCEEKPNGDWVITFPIQAADGSVTVKEMLAKDFVEKVFLVYNNWILPGTALPDSAPGLTHNVSSTTTVRDDERAELMETIWENRFSITAMSFVPYLLDKKFRYAPREAVGAPEEALWNRLIKLYKPIDWANFKEDRDTTSRRLTVACGPGGVCEI